MNTTFPKPLTAAISSLKEVHAKGDPQAFLAAVSSCPQRDTAHADWKGLWAAADTWMYGPNMHASWRDQEGRPTPAALQLWDVQRALREAQERIALYLDCLARDARDAEGPDYVILDDQTNTFLRGDTWTAEEAQAQRFPTMRWGMETRDALKLPAARYLVTAAR